MDNKKTSEPTPVIKLGAPHPGQTVQPGLSRVQQGSELEVERDLHPGDSMMKARGKRKGKRPRIKVVK